MKDPLGGKLREMLGVDSLIWGSDFAHGQGYWPESQKAIAATMGDVPENERRSMLVENVIKYFHLDAAARSRKQNETGRGNKP